MTTYIWSLVYSFIASCELNTCLLSVQPLFQASPCSALTQRVNARRSLRFLLMAAEQLS